LAAAAATLYERPHPATANPVDALGARLDFEFLSYAALHMP